ncbi:MAG: hypothetical protein ACOC1F_11970 [Myxococcota bacterium]
MAHENGTASYFLADDDSLFVVATQPERLVRVEESSAHTVIQTGEGIGFVALDPGPTRKGMLYVGRDTDPDPIIRLPKTGGDSEVVLRTKGVFQGLHADGRDVYAWGYSGQHQRWDLRKVVKGNRLETWLPPKTTSLATSPPTPPTSTGRIAGANRSGTTVLTAGAVRHAKR